MEFKLKVTLQTAKQSLWLLAEITDTGLNDFMQAKSGECPGAW